MDAIEPYGTRLQPSRPLICWLQYDGDVTHEPSVVNPVGLSAGITGYSSVST